MISNYISYLLSLISYLPPEKITIVVFIWALIMVAMWFGIIWLIINIFKRISKIMAIIIILIFIVLPIIVLAIFGVI